MNRLFRRFQSLAQAVKPPFKVPQHTYPINHKQLQVGLTLDFFKNHPTKEPIQHKTLQSLVSSFDQPENMRTIVVGLWQRDVERTTENVRLLMHSLILKDMLMDALVIHNLLLKTRDSECYGLYHVALLKLHYSIPVSNATKLFICMWMMQHTTHTQPWRDQAIQLFPDLESMEDTQWHEFTLMDTLAPLFTPNTDEYEHLYNYYAYNLKASTQKEFSVSELLNLKQRQPPTPEEVQVMKLRFRHNMTKSTHGMLSCTQFVGALLHFGYTNDALEIYLRGRTILSHFLDPTFYHPLMAAFAHRGDYKNCLAVIKDMEDDQIEVDQHCIASLIEASTRASTVATRYPRDKAFEILHHFQKQTKRMDPVLASVVFQAIARSQDTQSAIDFYNQRHLDITWNDSVWWSLLVCFPENDPRVSLIVQYMHQNRVKIGRYYFNLLPQLGIKVEERDSKLFLNDLAFDIN
ncbi:hypothetical protein EDD86DRAFT_245957 [Gorgonomyces haynaldii]|nr:hypothetical protein EDD86DRAFT_245957 [Gorgonomyces haynaldii]